MSHRISKNLTGITSDSLFGLSFKTFVCSEEMHSEVKICGTKEDASKMLRTEFNKLKDEILSKGQTIDYEELDENMLEAYIEESVVGHSISVIPLKKD